MRLSCVRVPGGCAIETTDEEIFEVVRPAYAGAFQCLGPECEDDCCHGWAVPVDHASYDRYQLISAESLLQPVMRQSLELLPEPRTEQWYGHIRLKADLRCPFLTEERWCGIQQEMGLEALSAICAGYPRVELEAGGVEEMSLQLSCPEAARLVLFNPVLFALPLSGEGGRGNERGSKRYEGLAARVAQAAAECVAGPDWLAIRSFLLLVVTDREYPLWQRLFLMGMFCGRLQSLIAGSAVVEIPQLVGDYCQVAGGGMLRPVMESISGRPERQLAMVLCLIEKRLHKAINSLRFLECTKEFLDGIGYRPGLTTEVLAPRYTEARLKYFEPWMKAHPQVLENYLVNAIFKLGPRFVAAGVPEGSGVAAAYLELMTHYALIRGLLVGMAGFHGESFGEGQVVKLVQSYGRMIEHHPQFLKEMVAFLGEQTMGNASGMALMLRE